MTALLAHRVHGRAGPWVLLLHGIGGGQAIWDDACSGTASALAAAGFRAVTVDLPGYGESGGGCSADSSADSSANSIANFGADSGADSGGDSTSNLGVQSSADSSRLRPCDMPAMAHHVLRLADALAAQHNSFDEAHPAPLVLLGHSMGGMVVQQLVAQHPRRAAALVLACTSAAFGPPGGDWQARFVADRLAPLDAGLGMAGMAAALVPPMLGPAARHEAQALAQGVMARVPEATYRAVLQHIANFDLREALPRISVPTLLLAGESDPTVPAALMQRMASRMPLGECVVLPGAGHIANVERPAEFNAAVIDFLQRHVRSESE